MLSGKKKFDDDGQEEKTDRYLITYADLITLLLGLFVILYAASQVDDAKYKEVSQALSVYFSSDRAEPLQGAGVLDGHRKGIPEPIFPHQARKSLEEVIADAESKLKIFVESSNIKIQRTGEGLVVTLPEMLLFSSGKAEIMQSANPILDSVAALLSNIEFQVTIDGHTDSVPIRTWQFESNWHLSVARALNVGYSLINKGIPEEFVVIRGFGSQRPVADNMTVESRALNRRVEITISELPISAPSVDGYGGSSTQEMSSKK